MALTGRPAGSVDVGEPSVDELGPPPPVEPGGKVTWRGGRGGGPRRRALLGSWKRQVVAGVIILGALAFLLVRGLTNATEYFLTTRQAVAQRTQLGSHDFRIEGTVEPDVHQAAGAVTFSIFADGTAVNVVSTAQPSQLFKPGIPVVLDGHWQGSVYACDQIMVKHTASYVEAHPGRLKSQLPAGR